MSNTELEKLTFEEAMQELEKLVDGLDKGDVSLEEAIAAYDRGSQLKDYCQKKLNEAKMKVETIQSSDNFVEGDGFTIDDFSISGFPNGMMGDYNLDASVDIYDLVGIVDILIFDGEPTESQLFFCDLDGSGDLDVMDLVALSNLILGI